MQKPFSFRPPKSLLQPYPRTEAERVLERDAGSFAVFDKNGEGIKDNIKMKRYICTFVFSVPNFMSFPCDFSCWKEL